MNSAVSIERLREVLHYDPETGVWTWLKTLSRRKFAGLRAGSVRPDGYRTICVDGRTYYSQRLAWFYMLGEWPEGDIDHKNVTPGDDRWSNLRVADHSKNGANVRLSGANTSGFKGVWWHKQRGYWCAEITMRGKKVRFSGFKTAQLAHEAYVDAAKRLFGDFARAA